MGWVGRAHASREQGPSVLRHPPHGPIGPTHPAGAMPISGAPIRPAVRGGTVMTKQTMKTAAFWATTILGPTSFVIGGVLGLMGGPEVVESTRHLGYPLYFVAILSTWKLLGAIAITVPGLPRVKEWAYAGFAFDLTAAAISHAAVGDGAGDSIAPLAFLVLVVASYALRPASRRLAGSAAPRGSAHARRSAVEGSDAVARVLSAA